jgi:hypothetical protein
LSDEYFANCQRARKKVIVQVVKENGKPVYSKSRSRRMHMSHLQDVRAHVSLKKPSNISELQKSAGSFLSELNTTHLSTCQLHLKERNSHNDIR